MNMEFREAVLAQPENLRAAAEAFDAAVAEVDLRALCAGTIVFSGIGASAHAMIPAVLALRAAGRRAFAVSAAELREPGAARLGDAFVLVSQSGASAETLAALAQIGDAPVVAVSASSDSPLASAARAWLPLGPMKDTPVATLSYTATLQTLGMLCDALLGRSASSEGAAWSRIPDFADQVLARADSVADELAPAFASLNAIDAIGGAGAHASAGETALLAREALKVPASGLETREYLHGPLEAVDAGFGCVVFGGERERRLAGELTAFGAEVLMIGELADDAGASASVELPAVSELAAPVLQIMPVQLLVDRVADLRGLQIGPLSRHQDDTKVA
jgi:glucosamine--fructose-6-phosphate aminotransferase (isomerizing)